MTVILSLLSGLGLCLSQLRPPSYCVTNSPLLPGLLSDLYYSY